jgi:hypothetical protein
MEGQGVDVQPEVEPEEEPDRMKPDAFPGTEERADIVGDAVSDRLAALVVLVPVRVVWGAYSESH